MGASSAMLHCTVAASQYGKHHRIRRPNFIDACFCLLSRSNVLPGSVSDSSACSLSARAFLKALMIDLTSW